jgi:hypothetical protein
MEEIKEQRDQTTQRPKWKRSKNRETKQHSGQNGRDQRTERPNNTEAKMEKRQQNLSMVMTTFPFLCDRFCHDGAADAIVIPFLCDRFCHDGAADAIVIPFVFFILSHTREKLFHALHL